MTMANEITATSGGTLTDASGNRWTLTSAGVVDENGTPVPDGSGTSPSRSSSNVYYGQDATTMAWYTYSPTSQTWTSSAAPSLTPTPTPHQLRHRRQPRSNTNADPHQLPHQQPARATHLKRRSPRPASSICRSVLGRNGPTMPSSPTPMSSSIHRATTTSPSTPARPQIRW